MSKNMPLNNDSGPVDNYKIFIAYETSTGATHARNLKRAIQRRHDALENGRSLKPFYATESLRRTETIPSIINNYLQQCCVFIPIFTANAPISPAINEEINYVLDNIDRYKIIVCKDENLQDSDIPRRLQSYYIIDFSSPSDLANRVIIELDELIIQYPELFYEDLRHMQACDLEDLDSMGICRIFRERRNCPELDECIRDEIIKSTEIKIMANTARDFFGDDIKKFSKNIISFLKKMEKTKRNECIKLILLNPFSEAAFDRYSIEYYGAVPQRHDEVFNRYVDSSFFRDITNVMKWYAENSKYHKLIKLKFSSLTPQMFFFKTKNYTFIELYHNSPLREADDIDTDDIEEGAICIAGYLPVFMIDNDSRFGKLLDGHFKFAWKKGQAWNDSDKEIEKFKKDPKLYSFKHLINELNEKIKYLQNK